jgi:hypothetical protein
MTDENAKSNAEAELHKAVAARRAARALADLGLYDDAASRPCSKTGRRAFAALPTPGWPPAPGEPFGSMARDEE